MSEPLTIKIHVTNIESEPRTVTVEKIDRFSPTCAPAEVMHRISLREALDDIDRIKIKYGGRFPELDSVWREANRAREQVS